nr:hypothetical protein [Microvirga sp. HBU67692]
MLVAILGTVRPERPRGLVGIGEEPADGIVLMVAHRHQGKAFVSHLPEDPNGFELLGATVDEVAHADQRPVLMLPDAVLELIAQLGEEGGKLGCVSMDVGDNIKAQFELLSGALSAPKAWPFVRDGRASFDFYFSGILMTQIAKLCGRNKAENSALSARN